MDKVIEAMAKELALQTLGDDGLPTSRVVWEWVVTNDFTEEYYDKAKALLNLTYPNGQKMLARLDENQELPRNPNIMPSYIKNYNDAQQDMLNNNFRKVVLE